MWFFKRFKAASSAAVSPQAGRDAGGTKPPPAPPQAGQRPAGQRAPRLSHQELQFALLLPFLTAAERAPYLARLMQAAWRSGPWPEGALAGEPREQLQKWLPFAADKFAASTVEGVCQVMGMELTCGLQSIQTPRAALSRPVRMYWLLCQGRRIQHAYAALERLSSNREQALAYVWWVVAGL